MLTALTDATSPFTSSVVADPMVQMMLAEIWLPIATISTEISTVLPVLANVAVKIAAITLKLASVTLQLIGIATKLTMILPQLLAISTKLLTILPNLTVITSNFLAVASELAPVLMKLPWLIGLPAFKCLRMVLFELEFFLAPLIPVLHQFLVALRVGFFQMIQPLLNLRLMLRHELLESFRVALTQVL